MSVTDLPRTVLWVDGESGGHYVRMVDQRLLPEQLVTVDYTTYQGVDEAILTMVVRGAPAIGIAGAYAVALWANNQSEEDNPADFLKALNQVCDEVAAVRPTAINLSWAVERMRSFAYDHVDLGLDGLKTALADFADSIRADDEATCRAIGENGAKLFASFNAVEGRGARIETHCNAGSLATAFFGTALSVVYFAQEKGYLDKVWVDETRPVNQGARLTAWELTQAGVPATLICDNMAASIMAKGWVDAVIVGADVVCSNGDVINKIGTYGLAVLAKAHGIPFYVAAPNSTIAISKKSAADVVIEQRAASEILDTARAPEGMEVYNPSFDATPAEYVTAIITENGVYAPDEILVSLGMPAE